MLKMSWLRSSPLRQSFSRTSRSRSIDATNTDCDPKACYDSFCKHWQQVYEIILRGEVSNQISFSNANSQGRLNFSSGSIDCHKWSRHRCEVFLSAASLHVLFTAVALFPFATFVRRDRIEGCNSRSVRQDWWSTCRGRDWGCHRNWQ